MEQQRISYLLNRLADDLISVEEKDELLTFLHNNSNEVLTDAGEAFFAAREHLPANHAAFEGIAQDILSVDRKPVRRNSLLVFLRSYRVAAAAVIFVVAASVYMLLHKPVNVPRQEKLVDVQPGREGAILTRSDGTTIMLDSLHAGELKEKNGARARLQQGLLSYAHTNTTDVTLIFNTITTPNARTFHLRLEDGTEIWLNAGSSVTYPVVFTGKERKVKITGEAYFEVAKAAGKPFIVNINDRAEVEVLGTHFNVNAYTDEPAIRTALLEGSVKVHAGRSKPELLKPGQQAVINGEHLQVMPVEQEEVTAWRKGLFHFRNTTIPDMMRQVARWYDVDVRFEGEIPERTFSGDIERKLSLQQVLAILRVTRINFTIDNQTQITIRN